MSFLDELLASTRERVAGSRRVITDEVLEQRIASQESPRGFAAAVGGPELSVIAEIKRATPSKGALALDLDPRKLAAEYAAGGAAALSVLTEPEYFKGSLEDFEGARSAGLPVLRKDFVIDEWQIFESRAAGADAVLLIVRCIGDNLARLHKTVLSLGMDALVEVYDASDLERAVEVGATLIGVNHRDLETFDVHPQRTQELAPLIPGDATLVALSGVSDAAEARSLHDAGAAAILVGEALVTANDPAAKIRELRGV